jgi:hypothetical protein
MNVNGTVHSKGETQQVSDKFSKRTLVLKTDENTPYPNFIEFQATQNKCELLDSVNVGQQVEVSFNLNGKLWTNKEGIEKCFNSLNIWRISQVGDKVSPVSDSKPDDSSDLPFN